MIVEASTLFHLKLKRFYSYHLLSKRCLPNHFNGKVVISKTQVAILALQKWAFTNSLPRDAKSGKMEANGSRY